MLVVLVPAPTSEHCLLSEAVEYAALGRLPLNCNPIVKFVPAKTGWQEREDFRWQQAVSDYASEIGLPAGYVPSRTSVPPERYEAAGVDLGPLLDAIGSQPKAPIDSEDRAVVMRREEAFTKYQDFFDSYRLRLRNLLHD